MREIKFRGKNYGGIWLYGYLMPAEKPVINKGCKCRISVSPQACAGKDKMVYEVITDTVGQFTGLKDKNGRDIYEGDIVIRHGRGVAKDSRGVVLYQAGQFSVSILCPLYYDIQDIEVIGNIHDKPELLKS